MNKLERNSSGEFRIIRNGGIDELKDDIRDILDDLGVENVEIFEDRLGNVKVTGLQTGHNIYTKAYGMGSWVGVGLFQQPESKLKVVVTPSGGAFADDFLNGIESWQSLKMDVKNNIRYDVYVYDKHQFKNSYSSVLDDSYKISSIANTGKDTWLTSINQTLTQALEHDGEATIGVYIKGRAGQFISDKVTAFLAQNSTRLTIVATSGQELQEVLQQQGLQESGIYDAETNSKIGKLVGAKYLLGCNTYLLNNKEHVELICKVVNVATGVFLRNGSLVVQIPKPELPL